MTTLADELRAIALKIERGDHATTSALGRNLRDIADKVSPLGKFERLVLSRAERRAAIVARYAELQSLTETAKVFGVTRQRVDQVVRGAGIKPRSKKEAYAARMRATDAKVAELHRAGLNNAAIAKRYGMASVTVCASLRRQGLRRNKKPISDITKTVLLRFDEGETPRTIAQSLGLYEPSVRVTLSRYGRTVRARDAAGAMP